jgi:spermidine/putrescine transport system permease protein
VTTSAENSGSGLSDRFVMIAAVAVLLYLFLPVAYTFAFSFNNYKKSNIAWNPEGSPTLKHWQNPCGAPGICESLGTSIRVGAIATLVATILGTMLAFASCATSSRDAAPATCCLHPDGHAGNRPGRLAADDLRPGLLPGRPVKLGFWTIVLAHIMFCLSFVVVTVKARPAEPRPAPGGGGRGPVCRTRAARSGGSPSRWCCPGIVSAALLSFSLSFDDFIITNFVSGNETTFPKFVYVSYLRGIPAQANVIGFSMFVIAVLLVVVGQVIGSKRRSPAS